MCKHPGEEIEQISPTFSANFCSLKLQLIKRLEKWSTQRYEDMKHQNINYKQFLEVVKRHVDRHYMLKSIPLILNFGSFFYIILYYIYYIIFIILYFIILYLLYYIILYYIISITTSPVKKKDWKYIRLVITH